MIAVVIPCYNHAKILRRTLESLTKQTVTPAEVVIIDDGSTDDPSRVVAEFNGRLPIRFVRFDKNFGAPKVRNVGFKMTASPYVIFLDADADLVPTALETFTRALEKYPEVGFAYSNFYWGLTPFRSRSFDAKELERRNFIHTSSLIRRDAFPGFDESLKKFQDWDLWLTMSERGSTGVWIDEFLYRIEPRRDGISQWLPGFAHKIPWPIFGWMPNEIRKYRDAEHVIREKHRLSP